MQKSKIRAFQQQLMTENHAKDLHISLFCNYLANDTSWFMKKYYFTLNIYSPTFISSKHCATLITLTVITMITLGAYE